MMTRWILRGAAIASMLATYDCGRRNNNNNSNNDNNANKPPEQPAVQAPVVQQPPMQQPPMQQPPMQQPGVAQNGMAPMQPMQPTAPGGDFITSQLQMRQQQFAAGMNPVMPVARGTLATSAKQNYSVPLQAGHCYKIIGVGGVGVTDLDLALFDPANTQADQDIATDNFPVIGLQRPLCPTVAGQYRLEVTMYTGQGEYGVQVFGN
jgi:hypothetical protein